MALIQLTWRARTRLQETAHSSANARQVRRAQALVWLDAGESVDTVARRLGVSRQAIYDWVDTYRARQKEPVAQRVCDRRHIGRPPTKVKAAIKVIEPLLKRDPRRYGYRSPVWTVPLLRHRVQRRTGQETSTRTVRRALHRLRYRCKRPRYVLASRSPTWRQVKGGS